MYQERFKKAIEILSKVDPRYFDLETWGQVKTSVPIPVGTFQPLEKQCGTLGCAIGWIASDPWIQKEGLHLYADRVLDNVVYCLPQYNIPGYGIAHGFQAVAAFFDILYDHADRLFCRSSYPYEEIEDEGRTINRPVQVEEVIARMEEYLGINL